MVDEESNDGTIATKFGELRIENERLKTTL